MYQGVYILGGKCPGGICQGGKCPGGICPWGKCPGGKCPGGLCPRTVFNTCSTRLQHMSNTSLEIKYLVSLIIFISVYKFIDICFNVKWSGMVYYTSMGHFV